MKPPPFGSWNMVVEAAYFPENDSPDISEVEPAECEERVSAAETPGRNNFKGSRCCCFPASPQSRVEGTRIGNMI